MIHFNCYQCDRMFYLFEDSRCKDCTRDNLESELAPISAALEAHEARKAAA